VEELCVAPSQPLLSKQRRNASEQKSMDFPILQQSGAREGGLGKMGEEKESTCKDMNINILAILTQYLHLTLLLRSFPPATVIGHIYDTRTEAAKTPVPATQNCNPKEKNKKTKETTITVCCASQS